MRIIGYDNAEGKGHHRHYDSREELYKFNTLRQLADDFLTDKAQFKRRLS